METLSIAECRKHLSAFQLAMQKLSHVSKKGTEMVQTSIRSLNASQRILLYSVTAGSFALYFVARYFRRKSRIPWTDGSGHGGKDSSNVKKKLRASIRRARQLSNASKGTGGNTLSGSTSLSRYNWAELQKEAGSITEKDSITSAGTLVDGTPLTPQQLGLMGMEALETVVGYWEDALAAYNRPGVTGTKKNLVLTSPEEAEFIKLLENILEGAYTLQDDGERMFIHQHSILNRQNRLFETFNNPHHGSFVGAAGDSKAITGPVTFSGGLDNAEIQEGPRSLSLSYRSGSLKRSNLLSVSSVDQESFVSAQDTIADLRDFEDLEIAGIKGTSTELYFQALNHLESKGIPCRSIRTEFVQCTSDSEYLAKLHCLRLGFKHIMVDENNCKWWADSGRQILSDLLIQSDKDPKDFQSAYDEMLEFLNGPPENISQMAEELQARNVKCTNFYDVALDYILIDSFEDLEAPPSSVIAVMNNRWLSNGFKETALITAIWSVLAAKRRLLKYPDGFKSLFYTLSEILLPCLAWGFFGPDEELNQLMNFFKEQVLTFIRDLYNFQHVRYCTVEVLAQDIMTLAKTRVEATLKQAGL
jgi:hypothetical protein